jgi:hypothetical protein
VNSLLFVMSNIIRLYKGDKWSKTEPSEKFTLFWDVTPGSPVGRSHVSEEPAASIFSKKEWFESAKTVMHIWAER